METKKSDLVRAFVKGGILSPADMLRIMNISQSVGNKFVVFGSRQDIMFPSQGEDLSKIENAFAAIDIDCELGSDQSLYHNIVSSYVAVNVVETTNWVKEDTYHFVIDNFDYKPRLKINIVEPLRSLVPLLTGELYVIASREEGRRLRRRATNGTARSMPCTSDGEASASRCWHTPCPGVAT